MLHGENDALPLTEGYEDGPARMTRNARAVVEAAEGDVGGMSRQEQQLETLQAEEQE